MACSPGYIRAAQLSTGREMAGRDLAKPGEPTARSGHVALAVGKYMFLWGGFGPVRQMMVERFDVVSATWEQLEKLHGSSFPSSYDYMTVATDCGKSYYAFLCHPYNKNGLFTIDPSSLECKELTDQDTSFHSKPSSRSQVISTMVCCKRKLVLYGASKGFPGWNTTPPVDELHAFDLDEDKWSAVKTRGEKPVAPYGHTLTMIDDITALLFGGDNNDETYLLDLTTWIWSKLKVAGKKPPVRVCHTTNCITKGSSPIVAVIGGVGDKKLTKKITYTDVWLLDVRKRQWSEVNLPTAIPPRSLHTSVVFGNGPDFRIIVLFGGRLLNKPAFLADTTLLLFIQRGGVWVIDRVVGPADFETLWTKPTHINVMIMLDLSPSLSDEDISMYTPGYSGIAPLIINFKQSVIPLSCFVPCLIEMYNWGICKSDDGSPACVAHNVVSLYDPQLPVQIIIVSTSGCLEIHVLPEKDINSESFPKVCFTIRETVFSAINCVIERIPLTGVEISPAFTCPCSSESKSHIASPYKSSVDEKWFLRCSITERSVGAVEDKHLIWLDAPVSEKKKPTLPLLYDLKVPNTVGIKYKEFGTLLLNDTDGSRVDVIENDKKASYDITIKILQEWVVGRGKSATWHTLAETLRDCKLNADNVEKMYL